MPNDAKLGLVVGVGLVVVIGFVFFRKEPATANPADAAPAAVSTKGPVPSSQPNLAQPSPNTFEPPVDVPVSAPTPTSVLTPTPS